MKCPYCNKDIEIALEKMEYHKHGRTANCPHANCGKKITFTRSAKNLTYDKNGTLKKKYVPKNKK